MSFEEQHVAHPRLYGAPAYARPPLLVATAKPIDPDDLPITAYLTPDEREIVASLRARQFGLAPSAAPVTATASEPRLQPERLSLTERAGRLLGRAS